MPQELNHKPRDDRQFLHSPATKSNHGRVFQIIPDKEGFLNAKRRHSSPLADCLARAYRPEGSCFATATITNRKLALISPTCHDSKGLRVWRSNALSLGSAEDSAVALEFLSRRLGEQRFWLDPVCAKRRVSNRVSPTVARSRKGEEGKWGRKHTFQPACCETQTASPCTGS